MIRQLTVEVRHAAGVQRIQPRAALLLQRRAQPGGRPHTLPLQVERHQCHLLSTSRSVSSIWGWMLHQRVTVLHAAQAAGWEPSCFTSARLASASESASTSRRSRSSAWACTTALHTGPQIYVSSGSHRCRAPGWGFTTCRLRAQREMSQDNRVSEVTRARQQVLLHLAASSLAQRPCAASEAACSASAAPPTADCTSARGARPARKASASAARTLRSQQSALTPPADKRRQSSRSCHIHLSLTLRCLP